MFKSTTFCLEILRVCMDDIIRPYIIRVSFLILNMCVSKELDI